MWMMWGRIYARKEGPDKALRVRGVLGVCYRCLLSQPLRSLQPGRALEWAVFRNNNYKFFNSLQCEAATAPIPMLDLTGEVGGNDVENTSDSKCFVWSLLSSIYPAPHNPDRISHYLPYENTLNLSGLTFPMPVKDIPKFEKQNPSISVNVLCKGDDGGLVPLYVTKERERRHHVNLFLIEGPDNQQHYVCIKSMSHLVAGRTKSTNTTFVCNYCLHPFDKKDTLERHIPNCQRHPPQDVKYPDSKNPKECVAEFRNKAARFRLPFYLVCDFESFLSPVHNDNDDAADVDAVKATNLIDEHRVCGFACYRVSEYPQYQTDPVVYSGPDVMDKFYEHIMRESQEISSILANDLDMTPLTDGEQTYYDAATVSGECGVAFTAANHKVRHHDHVSGQYLFPACNNCNLTLKMPNRKRKVTQGHKANKKVKLDEQQDNKFFLPLVFHNLRSYDSHFVIKH